MLCHTLQQLNNYITDVCVIQVKGVAFGCPPTMYKVLFVVGRAVTEFAHPLAGL